MSVPLLHSRDGIVIRRADLGDATAVSLLFDLGGHDLPPPVAEDGDLLRLAEQGRIWLALSRGEPVGFIVLRELDPHRASFRWLWVDARHRRQGIARRLLETAMDHCRESGYLKIVLDLPLGREAAVRLFQATGFTLAREREREGRRTLEFYLDLYREPGTQGST